jgi:dolichol-phosphate mannosyltransferase
MPNLNEQNTIKHAIDKISKVMKNYSLSYEIIVIDDNSSDNSIEIVSKVIDQNKNNNIFCIKNNRQKGVGHNYLTAAIFGRGQFIMLVGSDNSESEESLVKMLNCLLGMDRNLFSGVVPYFEKLDNRSIFRRILSKIFTKIIRLVSGINLKYFNGPTLHLRENIIRYAPSSSGISFQAELLCKLIYYKKSFVEVQIDNTERRFGNSKVLNISNLLSVSHSLLQIIFLRIRSYCWPEVE